MTRTIRRLRHAAIGVALGALSCALGCGGLSDAIVEQAETTRARIEREAADVDSRVEKFSAFAEDSDNAFLRIYIDREGWGDRFDEARTELEHTRTVYEAEIAPRLKANRTEDEAVVGEQLSRIRTSLDRVAEIAREPAKRAAFLKDARDRAPEIVSAGAVKLAEASAALRSLEVEIARVSSDYAEKREDLAGRRAGLGQLESDARASQAVAEREAAGIAAGTADLAAFADAGTAVVTRSEEALAGDVALRAKMKELYRSYSKTLLDMKEENIIQIGRTSWNESYDFPRETEVLFKVEVQEETLGALESWGDRPIGSIGSSWGRSSLNVAIDREVWDSLRIDPVARFPRGDSRAEFWVGESESKYYHRYALVEGDESSETDWEEVTEETYGDYYDDLGMDIVSKPYGSYEDEVLTEAAPAGMAYVGNPKYGRWETDNQGRRHWSWGESFLFYYLVFGGRGRHYYYYNDWNRWNSGYRGRRSWYGPSGGAAVYGTYGSSTRNSSRYANSGFARAGGFVRADRSIRGAGPSGRGGGPGGGGK